MKNEKISLFDVYEKDVKPQYTQDEPDEKPDDGELFKVEETPEPVDKQENMFDVSKLTDEQINELAEKLEAVIKTKGGGADDDK